MTRDPSIPDEEALRAQERAAWRERMERLRHPPQADTLELAVKIRAENSLTHDLSALPGAGMYPQQRLAQYGAYISAGVRELCKETGRASAAAALRRLADKIEREGPDGAGKSSRQLFEERQHGR